ncbi:Uncharacterised protein [Mycobacteroides abscessus subsp. abscessus]|nr:Uncharacterised protein [Mycobacteroides abscessus subsp. abscessus]
MIRTHLILIYSLEPLFICLFTISVKYLIYREFTCYFTRVLCFLKNIKKGPSIKGPFSLLT